MSKENVEKFLEKGAGDRNFRLKYDNCLQIEKFTKMANEDGFEFTIDELNAVLNENGDTFDSLGNPPKKDIWV